MKDLDQTNLDPTLMVTEVVLTLLMSLMVKTSWGILIERGQLIKDNKIGVFPDPIRASKDWSNKKNRTRWGRQIQSKNKT